MTGAGRFREAASGGERQNGFEVNHESAKQRQEDVRELQGDPAKGDRAGDLHEPQAQAASGVNGRFREAASGLLKTQ